MTDSYTTNDPPPSFEPRPHMRMEDFATFAKGLMKATDFVYEVNSQNGWFDKHRTFGEDIALLHSEVTEMLEAFRDSEMTTRRDEKGKPIGVPSEAADVLVRLLDTCRRYDIDLAHEFLIKMEYNATRGHRHGGKTL